jgi:hypothetical protein
MCSLTKKDGEMNNKKTPVEWFFEKIKSHLNGDDEEAIIMAYAVARQKERDNSREREAYQAGYNNGNIDTCLTYDQWKEAKQ